MNFTRSLLERFLEHVHLGEGCWLWQGTRDERGYGKMGHYSEQRAHRIAWHLAHGKPAGRLCVLHKCDTPRCVKPSHLFLGTRADNTHDMDAKGRRGYITRAPWAAKLTPRQVVAIRKELLKAKRGSQAEIGRRYGVSQVTIWNIANRKRFNYIP